MGYVSLLFPALIFCYVRNKMLCLKYDNRISKLSREVFQYVCGNVLINFIIISIRVLVFEKSDNVFESLNLYSDFAVKYFIVALLLAVAIPVIEMKYIKNMTISIDLNYNRKQMSAKTKSVIVILFGVAMAFLHFVRCFDNCFWGDEGILIVAARKDWAGMLEYVAMNGHSPFHYAFTWLVVNVFGESGFIYHFTATMPYFITVALGVTVIRKWFGGCTSVVFITLCTLLDSAMKYNLEVRMYGWCQVFILLSFLMAYKIYTTKNNIYYVLLTLFSIGAVYTHYYALASIGIVYFVLLLYKFKDNKKEIWKIILSGVTVLGCLFPWLVYAKEASGVVVSDYGIQMIEWKECVEFIFLSKHSFWLLNLFIILLVVLFIFDSKIIQLITDEKKKFNIKLSFGNMQINRGWIWILGGVSAVFGTIIASRLISEILYPIIVLRYLYPANIIMWLLFAVLIGKLKFKRFWVVVLVMVIVSNAIPTYIDILKEERANNKRLEETLDKTVMDENDQIYTDIVHFAWTVSKVYYPNNERSAFGPSRLWGCPVELPRLSKENDYWLFLGGPISNNIIENLANQQMKAELIVDKGYIGTGDVWVYKVIKLEDEVSE
ncbi:MAG: hypothetical protein U0L79_01880 [Lachnospiraceae bacterium]|nr:hypothetical protein [Lachnospiraceae bacterium]